MRLLATKWFGVVLLEGPRVLEQRLFPKDAKAIAARLAAIRRGEILADERAMAKPGTAVAEQRLSSLGRVEAGTEADIAPPEGYDPRLIHDAAIELARLELQGRGTDRDRFLAHAVRMLDEVQTSSNTLVERLREWYGVLDPTGSLQTPDPAAFAESVASGSRAGEAIDTGAVRTLAATLGGLMGERKELESLVAREVKMIAPRLSRLVGETVAARLIAKAGSLERLAYLPSSTVQVLGAENALFEHLKLGKKPPKHGVLYQHPLVHGSPPRLRGRISRLLASKASLAARADLFLESRDGAEGERLLKIVEARAAALAKAPAAPRPTRGPPGGRGPPPRGYGPPQGRGPPPGRPRR